MIIIAGSFDKKNKAKLGADTIRICALAYRQFRRAVSVYRLNKCLLVTLAVGEDGVRHFWRNNNLKGFVRTSVKWGTDFRNPVGPETQPGSGQVGPAGSGPPGAEVSPDLTH